MGMVVWATLTNVKRRGVNGGRICSRGEISLRDVYST